VPHFRPTHRAGRPALVAFTATLAVVGLLLTSPDLSGANPPPPLPHLGPAPHNPSDHQISNAQQAKQALANRVGQLGGQIAEAEAQLRMLQGKQELAEQRVALAISQLRDAQQAAAQARARVQAAAYGVQVAHRTFVQYVQASYMDGGIDTSTGTLLTASDPAALLDTSSLQHYQAADKLDAIGRLERATVIKSNADAKARAAVIDLTQKAAAARRAKAQADAAVAAQQQEKASLDETLKTSRAALAAAQLQLATLNHQRTQYLAYKAEQARIARIKARRAERRQRIRAAHLAALRAAAARRAAHERALERARERAAAARLAAQARSHRGGGGGHPALGHGGGAGFIAHRASGWTPSEAATAVHRALSTLGTPYAWAGGNSFGPTFGVCDASNGAPNDCHVFGFDCSGLAMYGWGPFLTMPHFAAAQYWVAGHFHPSPGALRPGDLVFWSYNGMASGIHHVAMYIGNGRIIEAPFSGGFIRIASLWEYGSIFGATRPLT
jgi:peptidoglycan DL-endopeptidase RipA